jgi:hypothetical protein
MLATRLSMRMFSSIFSYNEKNAKCGPQVLYSSQRFDRLLCQRYCAASSASGTRRVGGSFALRMVKENTESS